VCFEALALSFEALALSEATGILADTGTFIYGDGYRSRTVKIGNPVAQVRRIIDAIGSARRDRKPPPARPEKALRCLRLPVEVSRSGH
jgi:hypothetical protein